MTDIKQIIAKNISALRQDKELTQIELAEKLNYSDKAVSKWERGESLPDIGVLTQIADLFEVPLDYLVRREHNTSYQNASPKGRTVKNRGFITGMAVLLVWLVATVVFVILYSIPDINTAGLWLSFIYAVPTTLVVWLIFNCLWFNKKRNFLIISLLMWSTLGVIYLTLALLTIKNLWLIFIVGIPSQVIIVLWSGIKFVKKERKTKNKVKD